MYASIRRYNVKREQIEEVTRHINSSFVPKLNEIPGFVSYDVLNTGGRLATVSVFETRDGVSESTRLAAEFMKKDLATLRLASPEIFEGEVSVHKVAAEHFKPALVAK